MFLNTKFRTSGIFINHTRSILILRGSGAVGGFCRTGSLHPSGYPVSSAVLGGTRRHRPYGICLTLYLNVFVLCTCKACERTLVHDTNTLVSFQRTIHIADAEIPIGVAFDTKRPAERGLISQLGLRCRGLKGWRHWLTDVRKSTVCTGVIWDTS
jgi:hypothetical protein